MPIFDVLPVPSDPPVGGTSVYCIRLPDDRNYRAIIVGCLSYGADEESYDDPNTLPPDSSDIVEAFDVALESLEKCENSMIGTIQAASFKAGVEKPDGWLLCDGIAYNTEDYPELVAVSNLILVSGNKFFVPDLRGRNLRGVTSVLPPRTTGGNETKTLSSGNLPSHTHQVNGISSFVATVGGGAPFTCLIPASPGFPFPTGSSGSSTPFSLMNPYFSTDFYIVAR